MCGELIVISSSKLSRVISLPTFLEPHAPVGREAEGLVDGGGHGGFLRDLRIKNGQNK